MSDYSSVAPPQNFSQSSAFAAALQRAKQIAAKINPTAGGPPPGEAGRPKRPLEDGSEPDAKKLAGLDYNSSPPGLSAAAAQAAAVAARVAAGISQPPGQMGGLGGGGGGGGPPGPGGTCNEDIRVPDKMVGLIIGRGGEQITRLQAECGCKIQMAPDSGGASERICSLSGPRDAVMRAREMIMNIVNQRGRSEGMEGSGGMGGGGGGGVGNPGMGGRDNGNSGSVEIMIPGPKVGLIIGKGGETIKQLQEKSGAKMVVIQDGPNQEQEKPLRITGDPAKIEYAKQLVYFLIAEMEKQSFPRDGPGGAGGGSGGRGGGGNGRGNGQRNDDRGNNQEFGGTPDGFEVFVPKAAVGVVIGKGGDMIKKIQMETGCRLQFEQTRGEGPGDRNCYLQGKPQQVDQAREMIEDLIDSVQRRDPNDRSRGGNNRGNDRGNGGQRGPHNGGGSDSGYSGWGGNSGNGSGGNSNRYEVSFLVPSGKCGVIIGRGGETIKQINQQSGAHCELDRRVQGNPNEKTFVIRGEHENVEAAKRIISDKVQMQLNFQITSGGGGMGAGPGNAGVSAGGGPGNSGPMGPTGYPGLTGPQGYSPQGWGYNPQAWGEQQQQHQQQSAGGQVQINPVTGQPDYSAQWIEYYRSLGMHREAEMIEQQNKAQKAGGQQAATGGQPTPGQNGPGAGAGTPNPSAAATPTQNTQQAAGTQAGQADYSVQWAEYYRSVGKIKEAEAIEAQMKQAGKQPSQQPQPAAGATPAAVPGPGGAFPNAAGPQGGGPYGGGFPGGVPGFFPTAGGQPNNPGGQFQGYGNYGNYPSNDSNWEQR